MEAIGGGLFLLSEVPLYCTQLYTAHNFTTHSTKVVSGPGSLGFRVQGLVCGVAGQGLGV